MPFPRSHRSARRRGGFADAAPPPRRAHTTRASGHCTLLALLACWALQATSPARAQDVFTLRDRLAGLSLARHASFLEDPSGELALEQVSRAPGTEFFRPAETDEPSFGFSASTYWVRLAVFNPAAEPRSWVLELGYPQLDHLTLFVPAARGGFEARETGDMVPFSRRDIDYRTFMFRLKVEPRQRLVYYMRIQSQGSINVPLAAWTFDELFEHQDDHSAFLWVFYGALMAMAVYNILVVMFTGQREHMYYVLLVCTIATWQFSIDGQTFQYLLPNQCWLANRMLPATISVGLVWAALFSRHLLQERTQPVPFLMAFTRIWTRISAAVALAVWLVPYQLAIVMVMGCVGFLALIAPFLIRAMGRALVGVGGLWLFSWQGLCVGIILTALRHANVLPPYLVFKWAIPLGGILQVTFLSLALAQRMNAMRDNVSQLNTQLLQNVTDLKHALARAEEATRVKSEFLATMSHELRTPLNAIINIPQGLVEQFVVARFATCKRCGGYFELDEGEHLGPDVSCADCGAAGLLVEEQDLSYRAKPSETVRFLRKIERAGKHLLKMVNAVLDYSKMDAGKFELQLGPVDLNKLIEEVADEMSELATSSGVRLVVNACQPAPQTNADSFRLRQVLVNLVGNAIKFSDGRGTVTLGVSAGPKADVVSVRDEGIGIAPENADKIFAGFVQVFRGDTRKYGGTGLGLSISRSLVRMHGGELWVESTPGLGSTFFFSIPRAPAEAPAEIAEAS
jgi:signal transduction histidine kinase